MEMSAGLSSKLLASTVEQAMLEVIPSTPGVMKSRSVPLWSPSPLAMFVKFLLASRLRPVSYTHLTLPTKRIV